MGRYKLGPQGVYFDPNDSGPDQASPDQIAAMQSQQPAPMQSPGPLYGGYRDPLKPIGIGGNPGGLQPQVIVNGPPGWYKPNPGAQWQGPNGTLPYGQNPPGYDEWKASQPRPTPIGPLEPYGEREGGPLPSDAAPGQYGDARMTAMWGGGGPLSYLGYGFGSQPQGGGLLGPFVSKLGTKAPNANSGGMGSAVMGALGSPLKKLGIF